MGREGIDEPPKLPLETESIMWKSIIAALVVAFLFTGCAKVPPGTIKSAPAPSPAVTAATAPTAPAHETATPLPTREAELQNLAASAGFVVAKWLENDYAGQTEKAIFVDQERLYEPRPWGMGMSGWGTVSLNWGQVRQPASTSARVMVYLTPTGEIDYSKPVKGVWLDLGATDGDLLAGISYDVDQESWITWLSSDSTTWYPLYYACVAGDCYAEGGEEPVEDPTEIKALDDRAAFSLGQSMALLFGFDWERLAPKR